MGYFGTAIVLVTLSSHTLPWKSEALLMQFSDYIKGYKIEESEFILRRIKRFLRLCPDRLCDPPSRLSDVWLRLFPCGKAAKA
jgi:hypothetical protein